MLEYGEIGDRRRTETEPPRPVDWRILSMPFGPSDDLTRSATASAPMIDAIRACSPFASPAPSSRTLTGENVSPIILAAERERERRC